MSEPLFKPVTDGEVVKLPTPLGQQHKFGDPWLKPSPAGRSELQPRQTERVCILCDVVKVTVHGLNGQHWREWRLPGSQRQFATLVAPRCEVLPQ
jgi:hypothetical protein